jgi:hypothetical protein
MVAEQPSSNEELRNRNDAFSMAGKTSQTVAVSHIPTYINQAGNFNLNSESETVQDIADRNYNSGSVLKEDDVFHIKRENNPILIIHNSSKGELN